MASHMRTNGAPSLGMTWAQLQYCQIHHSWLQYKHAFITSRSQCNHKFPDFISGDHWWPSGWIQGLNLEEFCRMIAVFGENPKMMMSERVGIALCYKHMYSFWCHKAIFSVEFGVELHECTNKPASMHLILLNFKKGTYLSPYVN